MLLGPIGGGRPHLRILMLKLGDDTNQWPLRVVRALQVSLLIAISLLWRKLYKAFKCYPWVLAPAFDESREEEVRRRALLDLFCADWCCVDAGLGRQLRKAFPNSVEMYCGTPLGEFLTVLFTRLVVTSTQVELQFSRYAGLTDTRSKRLGLAGLAAKAMNQTYKQIVESSRADVLTGQVRQPTSRARPVCTKKQNKGVNTSAFDLYKSAIKEKTRLPASFRSPN